MGKPARKKKPSLASAVHYQEERVSPKLKSERSERRERDLVPEVILAEEHQQSVKQGARDRILSYSAHKSQALHQTNHIVVPVVVSRDGI